MEGLAVTMRTAPTELGRELLDGGLALLDGPRRDRDRVLARGVPDIAQVHHRECRFSDTQSATPDSRQSSPPAHSQQRPSHALGV